MRPFAALAVLALLASGARADRADPLAPWPAPSAPGDPARRWVYELVLMCAGAGDGATALGWCALPGDEPAPPSPPPARARPAPVGSVAIASRQAHDPSTLTADQVAAKIRSSYLAGVRRCYRDALARRPALRGTLRIGLLVNAVGKTELLSIKGVDAIAGCVGRQAVAWRFPIPQSSYREPRNARFTIGLALAP